MTGRDTFDSTLAAWLHDAGAPDIPPRVYAAAFTEARTVRQARPIPGPIARWLPSRTRFDRPASAAAARWAALGVLGLVTLAMVAAALVGGGGRPAVERLTRLEGVFEPVGSLPGAPGNGRTVRAVVGLDDGGALVVAGSELVRFDPSTDSFKALGVLPDGRSFERAVLLRDGRVLLLALQTGGIVAPVIAKSAVVLDPLTGAIGLTGTTIEARTASAATVLQDGRVLITGGEGPGFATASAELFDPVTGTFSSTGSMARPRSYHASILLPDGRVLVAGGSGADLDDSAEMYDPSTGMFSPAARMAFPHSHFTATALQDGRVLLAAGISGGPSPEEVHATGRTQVYDPVTGRFTETGQLPAPRSEHAAALLPDGRVLIAGGVTEPRSRANVTADAQVYDPATGRFSPAGAMTEARFNFHAVALADGRVLIIGHEWLNPVEEPFTYAEEHRLGRSAEIFR